ncbi:Galectin-3-binding protein B [Stylophora pistillata]|uniref:Galectin-3-binding protein B n=1 Tax=Stylophora pistillata TaxID=50429 RepID=A0A2B4RRB1_STYPI|nr:Galectin-3-binding protein B [Stylophora pistillata]
MFPGMIKEIKVFGDYLDASLLFLTQSSYCFADALNSSQKEQVMQKVTSAELIFFIAATVRLVSPTDSPSSGRVEVHHNGTWGTICDDSWDLQDADVVCRQLRYDGALSAPGNATFRQGTGQIWLDDVNCVGNETLIEQCSHGGWGVHNCGHNDDAGIVCRPTAITEKVQSSKPADYESFSEAYQKHTDCGYDYKVVCTCDDKYIKPIKIYLCEKAIYKFMEQMLEELNAFDMRCLRRISGIPWQDRIPNTEVLSHCHMSGIEAYIMEADLRWTGHVVRMSAERLPRALLYSELSDGARKEVGALKKRFKDQLKSTLNKCDITDFDALVSDRAQWKTAVKCGVAKFEDARIEDLRECCCCRK